MSLVLPFNIGIDDPRTDSATRLFQQADAFYGTLYPDESNHPILGPEIVAKRGIFLSAKVEESLIGHVALVPLRGKVHELKRLYVVEDYRRRGVARRLLEALLIRANDQGVTEIVLETGVRQPEAQNLYKSFGFNIIAAFPPYVEDPNSEFYCMKLSSRNSNKKAFL